MQHHTHTHSCLVQGVARPESGMNVYGPASPFILQDLAQGTMCTWGCTCVRHEVMCNVYAGLAIQILLWSGWGQWGEQDRGGLIHDKINGLIRISVNLKLEIGFKEGNCA